MFAFQINVVVPQFLTEPLTNRKWLDFGGSWSFNLGSPISDLAILDPLFCSVSVLLKEIQEENATLSSLYTGTSAAAIVQPCSEC